MLSVSQRVSRTGGLLIYGSVGLVIFDCDGVLVDSEPVCARAFVNYLVGLGCAPSAMASPGHYQGWSMSQVLSDVETRFPDIGLVGSEIESGYYLHLESIFAAELEATTGIHEVLQSLAIPFCVASNGSHRKMRLSLSTVGLDVLFGENRFSATDVERPKPAPDLFLLAAESMNTPVDQCVVIEDSIQGVQAARAAGMSVLGYTGTGSSGKILQEAGAKTFSRMDELPALLSCVDGDKTLAPFTQASAANASTIEAGML